MAKSTKSFYKNNALLKMSTVSEQTIFVQNLIDAVREHRCLYDKKDTSYFNRREKEKAWRIIGQQLGRNDVACHRRWKLLREKFAKELKKRDRALKNGEPFQSDWSCFNNIMYIEDHIAPRKKNDKLSVVMPKNLTAKRMTYEHVSSADTTTEKRPYCPTSLDFLAQLSQATLHATQLSDSSSYSERNLQIQAEPKMENDDSQVDEMQSATTEIGSPTSTDSESSTSMTSHGETPTTMNSTNAVDALLRELRTNKESSLNFVKNLTNALKINNLDIFKEASQHGMLEQASNLKINEKHIIQKDYAQKSSLTAEAFSVPKDTHTNDDVVRSTLLRVNGLNNLGNKVPHESPPMEVTSTANQPTNELKDEIFGKMVVTMLGDITDEECKDDAKFGIMQVLINAKRACRNKQLNRQ